MFPKKKKEDKIEKKSFDSSTKYLPTTLLVGIQKDVNEKALRSFILSVSKTSFEKIGDVKFNIKKLEKNHFLYEIHNGSQDLTYLDLVYKKLFIEEQNEMFLKTNKDNVRLIKRPNGKIDTNVLLEHNNRDDLAEVDYETNVKSETIIKEGFGLFYTNLFLVTVSAIVALGSFVTKYSMTNEDYSFNYKKDNSSSPMEFISTLNFEHTEYQYLSKIEYSNGTWKETIGTIEKPKVDVHAPKVDELENIENLSNTIVSEPMEKTPVTEKIVVDDNTQKAKALVEEIESVNKEPEQKTIADAVLEMDEVSLDDINLDDYVVEEMPSKNVKEEKQVSQKTNVEKKPTHSGFKIIDMDKLKTLDLSNLPENIVIEEGDK